ncbi:restriction endonuclease [Kitasatospora xanthocidica]|uniref:Restriction endonuclease n=1 Tax=Kitasatospora xanthocidica TaxID=83382 RepID=A0A373A3K8_9ACTN|nr:NaeI family type II restriction endonuclease [Kitasatospora xanthocidica]RGD62242.1 restriction endonuclease [Kitasatospora xanthocidica]
MLPMLEPDGPTTADAEVQAVKAALYSLDSTGEAMGRVLRETIDQLLDGQRMGRWDYEQLHKTEKTHLGTLVEINIYKEFGLAEGEKADYLIDGIEVDCKYAKGIGKWEIGPELVGYVCLVVTADDRAGTWRAGLVRASEEHLRSTENRDRKRRLNPVGIAAVSWLWGGENRLAPNQLLRMDEEKRTRIMHAKGKVKNQHGQARINQLFIECQREVIRRVTIETVGHGLKDPLKRARGNGGARDHLRRLGILVLGHQESDPMIARTLGLGIPGKGEFVSVQVVPAPGPPDERPAALIQGSYWVAADGDYEPGTWAPEVRPRKAKADDS